MKNIIYIIIISNFIFSRNFIYNEESWYSIMSPKGITSISYNRDEVFFTSTNGLFIYGKFNNEFFYSDYTLSGIENKNLLIAHYDLYRDNLWILNSEKLQYKSNISNVWVDVYFHNLNIKHSRSINNIGSNPNYIVLQIRNNQYIFLDPYTGRIINNITNSVMESELLTVKWSSTSNSLLNNNFNLDEYYIFDGWNIVSNNQILKNGKRLYITCVLNQENGRKWFGTDTGELFYTEQYSNELQRFSAISNITNTNLAYLDNQDEWWFADNNWLYSSSDILFNQEVTFLSHWNERANIWTPLYQTKYPQIISKDINVIYRLENTLYIGTTNGLLIYYINLDRWELVAMSDGLGSNNIQDIEYDDDILYLATSMGLTTFSTAINKPIRFFNTMHNKDIFDICFFDKYLYILSSFGLFYLDILSDDIIQLTNRKFRKIETSSDRIILSKNNSLFILDSNFNIKLLTSFDEIKNFSICSNYIWVNTGNTAIIYNPEYNTKLRYNSSDGIVGKAIKNIDCNDSWVWFTTEQGLSFYNWRQFHYE